MKIIGLTGGIASGKSTVSKILSDHYGYPIVDADRIAREVVAVGSDGLSQIESVFGSEYMTKTGEMDRIKMGTLIRNDPNAKKKLEAITHPLIHDTVLQQFENYRRSGSRVAIYDCPLLFEAKQTDLVDAVLLVCVDPDIRIRRLMARDQISETIAKQKIAIQLSNREKQQQAMALNIPLATIDNSSDLDQLEIEIQKALSKLDL